MTIRDEQGVIFEPTEMQKRALSCPAKEVLYGGAKGGGKTIWLLFDFIHHAILYGSIVGVLIRRQFDKEYQKILRTTKALFPRLGGVYKTNDKTWDFSKSEIPGLRGSVLYFFEVKDAVAAGKMQGLDIQWAGWDELTRWPNDEAYKLVFSFLRSTKKIPTVVRSTANPGGEGHEWVSERFLNLKPYNKIHKIKQKGEYVTRCFIPCQLEDNDKIDIKEYEKSLSMLDQHLYEMYRNGRWDIVENRAFEEFDPDVHMIEPFELPKNAYKFISIDWGFATPFSVGWWAVVNNKFYRVNEWYGKAHGYNKGLRLSAMEVARRVKQYDPTVRDIVIDRSAFRSMGGESSVADAFINAGFNVYPSLSQTEYKKEARMMISELFRDNRLFAFKHCREFERAFKTIKISLKNPELIEETKEDHVYDEVRYGLYFVLANHPQDNMEDYDLDQVDYDIKEAFTRMSSRRWVSSFSSPSKPFKPV